MDDLVGLVASVVLQGGAPHLSQPHSLNRGQLFISNNEEKIGRHEFGNETVSLKTLPTDLIAVGPVLRIRIRSKNTEIYDTFGTDEQDKTL